jgi:hypothetical protein
VLSHGDLTNGLRWMTHKSGLSERSPVGPKKIGAGRVKKAIEDGRATTVRGEDHMFHGQSSLASLSGSSERTERKAIGV